MEQSEPFSCLQLRSQEIWASFWDFPDGWQWSLTFFCYSILFQKSCFSIKSSTFRWRKIITSFEFWGIFCCQYFALVCFLTINLIGFVIWMNHSNCKFFKVRSSKFEYCPFFEINGQSENGCNMELKQEKVEKGFLLHFRFHLQRFLH